MAGALSPAPTPPEIRHMKTQFFRVAASGKTIDGREITPAQIDQMAKSYDPKRYAARVNLEHYLSFMPNSDFRAQGDVIALKAEAGEGGTRVLTAQIDAGESLVKLAADNQKVFWSIEMTPNFAGSGEAYLVGLAATDTPASLFTERMKFALSHDKVPEDVREHLFSTQMEAAPLKADEPTKDDDKPGLFARVVELLAGKVGDDKRFGAFEAALTETAREVGALKREVAALKSTPPTDAAEVKKLTAELAALKTTLETTSPGTFRKLSGGGGEGTVTDC